jgi:hypothetical protein
MCDAFWFLYSEVRCAGTVLNGQKRDAVMEYITRQLAMESGKPGVRLCAKATCRKSLPADGTYWQSRGLKFCSLECSW